MALVELMFFDQVMVGAAFPELFHEGDGGLGENLSRDHAVLEKQAAHEGCGDETLSLRGHAVFVGLDRDVAPLRELLQVVAGPVLFQTDESNVDLGGTVVVVDLVSNLLLYMLLPECVIVHVVVQMHELKAFGQRCQPGSLTVCTDDAFPLFSGERIVEIP